MNKPQALGPTSSSNAKPIKATTTKLSDQVASFPLCQSEQPTLWTNEKWKGVGVGRSPDQHVAMFNTYVRRLQRIYCPGYAGVKGYDSGQTDWWAK